MKTASIVTFVLVAMLSASFAMAADGKKEKGAKVGGIYAKLDLTAEQSVKIVAIQEEAKEAMKKAGDDKDAKKAIGKEVNAKIEAVLTDAQKEQLAKLKADAKAEADKKKKEPK
jgi:Spy/CpxP family protein refolding chaperone